MSRKEAIEVFTFFKSKEGAQHIAKPVTLDFIITFCHEKRPKRVLEIGSGIGTISYAVLKYSDAILDMYEGNDWCISQLKNNLKEFNGRFSITSSMSKKPAHKEYDLIIIDGGAGAKGDFGTQSSIVNILKELTSIGNIYYEGDRREQQQATFEFLRKEYTFKCTLHKPEVYEGKSWIGGKSYILHKSNSYIARAVSFYYWYVTQQVRLIFRLQRKVKHYLK